MERLKTIWNDFSQEEDGVALTEYLVLLGLISAAVVVAVGLFGDAIAEVFESWETWFGANMPETAG